MKKLLQTTSLVVVMALVFIHFWSGYSHVNSEEKGTNNKAWNEYITKKKALKKMGYPKSDSPEKFAEFHNGIRTRDGETVPRYKPNYRLTEINKSKRANRNSRKAPGTPGILEYIERGPSNVPGRTRAVLVLPSDASHNTWLAGASGGGIWKTTNAGSSWTNVSPDLPTLAVTSIAMSDADENIVYAGTGEYIASSGTAIEGDGIFKSTDAGDTWTQLASTAGSSDFISVTRVLVDPNDPDIVLTCSAPNTWDNGFRSVIMKSTDGGDTWSNVYTVESGGAIEQVIADPNDFNTIYAGQNGVGVLKSTDAGETWTVTNEGMSISGRVELSVSPANTNYVYASTQGGVSGTASDLYLSKDKGITWDLVEVTFNGDFADFLGGQGWYDNTVVCSPYDENVVYFGGVGLFRTVLTGSSGTANFTDFGETPSFMDFVPFSASAAGGALEIGPEANGASVYVKFGPGRSQLAHRFTVPSNGGSNGNGGPGVPASDYSYQDYVEVPFEVYEVDEAGNEVRQLMVSFRDQQRDGEFNLNPRDDDNDPDLLTAREYIYVNNVDYDASGPNSSIAVAGGHEHNEMYFFWPILDPAATWDPDNLPESEVQIVNESVSTARGVSEAVADPYNDYNGRNSYDVNGVDVHPDQHYMVVIPEDDAAETYRIVLTNDGGVFVTDVGTDPGVAEGTWNFAGQSYNTSQFYGADKMPGGERYIGGMQDNGTWYSPEGIDADDKTAYIFGIGGDGFEAIWHSQDPLKMIGGSQNNGLRRTVNGGASWSPATSGLSGTPPFITKLAGSKSTPEVIYSVSSSGVFKSTNFGEDWNLSEITTNWVGSTFLDVEVSRANPDIVWGGSGMTATNRIHVSTDAGETFTQTTLFNEATLGITSKLASHPTEPNTAYALFSFAEGPKVLRTTDLGQTWEDISGYGSNASSSNGFPDVAVYCLYVRPDNTDIIWVGSEIGIIESLDNGATWALNEDFIHASVWDMKGQDNEIVMATHGRGIWSAITETNQTGLTAPIVSSVYITPSEETMVELTYGTDYDEVELYADDVLIYSTTNVSAGTSETVALTNASPGVVSFYTTATKNSARAVGVARNFDVIDLQDPANAFNTAFSNNPSIYDDGISIAVSFSGNFALQSPHNYADNSDISALIRTPITVNGSMPMMYYDDIAIVEPENDKVSVEGTVDGLNWVELASYDASANSGWLDAYNSSSDIDASLYVDQEINLSQFFSDGDLILIRFRLQSNSSVNAYGWTVDNLSIQQAPTNTERAIGLDLTVAPNPSNGSKLNIISDEEVVYMELVDLTGKTSRFNNFQVSGKMKSIETGNLNSGIYTLRIFTKDGFDTRKVVLSN